MMSRRFVPVIIAVAAVFVILHRGERNKNVDVNTHVDIHVGNDTRSDERRAATESRSSKQYALDVQKVNWPPLNEGEGSGTAPAAANTVNYYVVLDGSGSMLSKRCGGGSNKIDAAVDAVKRFFRSVPADANIGLAVFDRRAVSERVALGVDNRDALAAALEKVQAGSDTPLRTSIKIAYDRLTAQARTQLGYGEYHLVVVTDGQPDPASEDPTPIVKEILAQSPVVLHTIGFCIDSDHVLNQPSKTFYASATDPQQLESGLKAVLAEAPVFDATQFR